MFRIQSGDAEVAIVVLVLWIGGTIGWAVAIVALREIAKLRTRYQILARRNRELQDLANGAQTQSLHARAGGK